MQLDKSQILELLHAQDKHDEADQVKAQLPDKVDTYNAEHSDLLSKCGLHPAG